MKRGTLFTLLIGMICFVSVGFDVGPPKTADHICNYIDELPEAQPVLADILIETQAPIATVCEDIRTVKSYPTSTDESLINSYSLIPLHIDPGLAST